VAPKTEAKKKPRVSVLERRLQNPFGEPSSPIDLTDPAMVARGFNKAVGSQQIYKAKRNGWDFVTPDMIADVDQAGGYRPSTDGQRMVRGEREEEVLMYMPKSDREQIELAKAKKNVRDMQMGRQKEAVLQAAATQFGGQASDYLNGRIVGTVTDQIERIHSDANPDEHL
jgi:hypothetical protein